jgi:two-component system, cell cycle sensor histidine kinase and response regulator CckA
MRRTAVLDAVTYAATRIVCAPDWRPAMPELLARLGTAAKASRTFLFEMHAAPGGGQAQSCRFVWTGPLTLPCLAPRCHDLEECRNLITRSRFKQ